MSECKFEPNKGLSLYIDLDAALDSNAVPGALGGDCHCDLRQARSCTSSVESIRRGVKNGIQNMQGLAS